jgi:hypothetical protein
LGAKATEIVSALRQNYQKKHNFAIKNRLESTSQRNVAKIFHVPLCHVTRKPHTFLTLNLDHYVAYARPPKGQILQMREQDIANQFRVIPISTFLLIVATTL